MLQQAQGWMPTRTKEMESEIQGAQDHWGARSLASRLSKVNKQAMDARGNNTNVEGVKMNQYTKGRTFKNVSGANVGNMDCRQHV